MILLSSKKNGMKMKTILGLLLVLTSTPTYASFACFTGESVTTPVKHQTVMAMPNRELEMPQAMQCTTKSNVQKGLTAIAVSFSLSGFVAGCTGLGLPVTVAFEAGGLVVQVANMMVGELPCDEATPLQNVKIMVDEAVCAALEQNGLVCQLK